MKRWSPEEDAALRILYPRVRTSDIAAQLGRTVDSTKAHARNLGLRKASASEQSPSLRAGQVPYAVEQALAFIRGNVQQDYGGCLIWTGRFQKKNPLVWWRGDRWMARRLLWILSGREVPHRHVIRDRCGNRACMNLEHLHCGPKDEARGRARFGRSVAGWAAYEQRKAEFQRQNPGAKPDEYARAMRRLANELGV